MKKTVQYLSRPGVAARIGVKPDTLKRYKLPPPDGMVGKLPGWLPETIDAWNAARPGPGYWGNPGSRAFGHEQPRVPTDELVKRATRHALPGVIKRTDDGV